MPTSNEQILNDISTDIDQTIPDRPNAAAPTYKSLVIRALLKRIMGKAAQLSPTTVTAANGDGVLIPTETYPGLGILRFLGNLITGQSEFSLVNSNLAGNGFAFWQMLAAKSKKLLLVMRREGVGIGTDNPEELLHVAGRIKTFGLVATGDRPTAAILGSGLGTSGSIVMEADATNQAGRFAITTGSNPTQAQMARITFSNAVARRPACVICTPAGLSAAQHYAKIVLYPESASSMVLTGSGGGELPANTTLNFNYLVIV